MNVVLGMTSEKAQLRVYQRKKDAELVDRGTLVFRWQDSPTVGFCAMMTLVPRDRRYIVTFRLQRKLIASALDIVNLLNDELPSLGYHLFVDDLTITRVQRVMSEAFEEYRGEKEGDGYPRKQVEEPSYRPAEGAA